MRFLTLLLALTLPLPALAFKTIAGSTASDGAEPELATSRFSIDASGNCLISAAGVSAQFNLANAPNSKGLGLTLCQGVGVFRTTNFDAVTVISGTAAVGVRWNGTNPDIASANTACRIETAGPARDGITCGTANP